MIALVALALAPVALILFYVYFRDKYEKEPVGMLIKGVLLGGSTVIPVLFMGAFLTGFGSELFNGNIPAGYNAFITASLNEELFKYLAVLLLIWRSRHFNEKFDGIVYAVFVSLGFAAVENILYVLREGTETGILRAFTAVPGHAVFGIVMGFYLGLAKMIPGEKAANLWKALWWPVLLHGAYDYVLMSQYKFLVFLFLPLLFYLYRTGFRKMKSHSDTSRFNPGNM